MSNSYKNPVFILSLFDTGLYAARLLKNLGIQIFGFDYDKNNTGFFSNIIRSVKIDYPLNKNSNALEILLKYRSKFREKPILLIASEVFLKFVEINRSVFEKEFLFIIPNSLVINKILNRVAQFELAKNSGINIPEYLLINKFDDLKKVENEISFPAIIKGTDQVKWKKLVKKKVIYVDNFTTFQNIAVKLLNMNMFFFIQEIINGPATNNFEFNALSKDGKIIEFNINQKIIQYPIDFGSACYLRNVKNEAIEFLGQKFVLENNIEGFSNTEFKFNVKTGQFYFIETNARVWQQVELTKKIGQNFVLSYYNILSSHKVYIPFKRDFKSISWIDLPSYLIVFLRYRRQTNLNFFQFILSIIKAKNLGTLNFKDIKPFLKSIKLIK